MSDSSSDEVDLDRTVIDFFEEMQKEEAQKNLSGGNSKNPHSDRTPGLKAAKKQRVAKEERYDSDLDVSVGDHIFHFVRCVFNGHGSTIPSKDPAYRGPSSLVHFTIYVPDYVYDEAGKGNIQALRESLGNNSNAWIRAFEQKSHSLLLMRWYMPGLVARQPLASAVGVLDCVGAAFSGPLLSAANLKNRIAGALTSGPYAAQDLGSNGELFQFLPNLHFTLQMDRLIVNNRWLSHHARGYVVPPGMDLFSNPQTWPDIVDYSQFIEIVRSNAAVGPFEMLHYFKG